MFHIEIFGNELFFKKFIILCRVLYIYVWTKEIMPIHVSHVSLYPLANYDRGNSLGCQTINFG